MSTRIVIDPLTRIEGHLAVRVEVDSGRVTQAYCSGEMFRGFEQILRGRHPMDAQQITQRICGVCPVSHGMASVFAQEMAYNLTPPTNGRLIRNLVLGANYIHSHLIHFYHLSALDFVDIAALLKYEGRDPVLCGLKSWVGSQVNGKVPFPGAPFLPRYEGTYVQDTDLNCMAVKHYVEALEMRALAQQSVALFSGKVPHITALVPGGMTDNVTANKLVTYLANLKKLQTFIDESYLPDVVAVAKGFPDYFSIGKGCSNYLAYGVFPENDDKSRFLLPSGTIIRGATAALNVEQITEDVSHSLFSSPSGLNPGKGETTPAPDKGGAYTWLKAPRYNGEVMEVGPLARMVVAYHAGDPAVKSAIDGALAMLGRPITDLNSVLGRHLARALECKIIAARCEAWANQLDPSKPCCQDFDLPAEGSGYGLVEAPRGALGHWITVSKSRIANYQCVVPTTWNCSPRDEKGTPGTVEQALAGTPVADPANPIEAARVVRSFDPCIACAVH